MMANNTVPAFIIARANNAVTNKAIAAVLREAGINPSGKAWALATAHCRKGGLLTPAYLATLGGRKTVVADVVAADAAAVARADAREAKRAANREAHRVAQAVAPTANEPSSATSPPPPAPSAA